MKHRHSIILALLSAFVLVGCSHQALTIQAKIATSAHSLLAQSHDAIIDARGDALREAIASAETEVEARESVQEVKDFFEPILLVYALCRSSFNAWLAIMVRSLDDDTVTIEQIKALGEEFMDLYRDLVRGCQFMGIDIPEGEER